MWLPNSSSSSSPTFLLAGIPGLEAAHVWLSIPFTCIHIPSFMGNCTILFVIRTDLSLHKPMYQFFSMLVITSLGLSLSTMPAVMGVFWVSSREISLGACFAQLYFVHSFSFMESSVLLAMAFDLYVAISYPLRYSSILTGARIAKIGLAALCRSFLGVQPSLFLLRRLPFCQCHVLSHTYCLHKDLVELACADVTFNSRYGLAVVILVVVLDPLLIVFSYIMICKTTASQKEHLKALNNRLPHIPMVLILSIRMAGWSMVQHFSKRASPFAHVLLANIYLLAPTVLNPIIYSIKNKQNHRGFLQVLMPRRSFSPWHHSPWSTCADCSPVG